MSDLTEFRAQKDQFFRTDPDSPLLESQRANFPGLSYYDERPDLVLSLTPELYEEPDSLELQTSTGTVQPYWRWARVAFEIDGVPATLTLFRDADSQYLFLPFADAGAGTETYGAGRYVEVQMLNDGRLLIDFNYAYNPYCAYNERWTCPIPPAENRLSVPIAAGERVYAGHA